MEHMQGNVVLHFSLNTSSNFSLLLRQILCLAISWPEFSLRHAKITAVEEPFTCQTPSSGSLNWLLQVICRLNIFPCQKSPEAPCKEHSQCNNDTRQTITTTSYMPASHWDALQVPMAAMISESWSIWLQLSTCSTELPVNIQPVPQLLKGSQGGKIQQKECREKKKKKKMRNQ